MVRIFLFVEKLLLVVLRAFQTFRQEILWRWGSNPSQLAQRSYQQNYHHFPTESFLWEEVLLSKMKLPTHAKILVLGSGKGREAEWLKSQGFFVAQVDPFLSPQNTQKFYSCDALAFFQNHAKKFEAFDVVWFGWGLFSHFLTFEKQNEILQLAKQHSPKALMVLSYVSTLQRGRVEKWIHILFSKFFPSAIGLQDEYFSHLGFIHRFAMKEIESLAQRIESKILYHRQEPYPHLLMQL